MKLFVDSKWTGNEDRSITIREQDGSIVTHNIDEYAKEHGIELPDSKAMFKQPKDVKKEVNTHADMGKQDHSRDHKVNGNGDVKGSK